MKITFEHEEVQEAIEAYARTQINLVEGQKIEMSFTNGRGDKGISVDLQISSAADAKTDKLKPVTRRQTLPVSEAPEEEAEEKEDDAPLTTDTESETSEAEDPDADQSYAPEEDEKEEPVTKKASPSIFTKKKAAA